jgi:hypothetical protein
MDIGKKTIRFPALNTGNVHNLEAFEGFSVYEHFFSGCY